MQPVIFGEVLFDCFPQGEQVLGGAPFNVAWHLQALGDQPRFVSRVGNDELGDRILAAMQGWGMNTKYVQTDAQHQTGRVDVTLHDNEPHYDIRANCAYDFIDQVSIDDVQQGTILYHGTLALRHDTARHAFDRLAQNDKLSIFMDVNLRPPWWQANEVIKWLKQARWAKMNRHELEQLGPNSGDLNRDMLRFQAAHDLELLIVTLGAEGAVARNRDGLLHTVQPQPLQNFVDTVGAGDAFTSVILHGLMSQWPLDDTLEAAQRFASAVVGVRGAISDDPAFYQRFTASLQD